MNIKELHKCEFVDFPIQELILILGWDNLDDLDLCIFYKTSEGKTGGVFTPEYNNNKESSGSLTSFPYIYLYGEPRPCATNCEEIVRISKSDNIEEINIVIIDYPRTIDPEKYRNSHIYDFKLDVIGESTTIRMSLKDPKSQGTIWHLAKIIRREKEFRLFNYSSLINLSDAFDTIPGFSTIVTSN